MESFDFRKLQSEILTALRGHRSQTHMNSQLKHHYNKYAKWESGSALISWVDFVRIFPRVGINLPYKLYRTLGYNGDLEDIPGLLVFLQGDRDVREISTSLGRYHRTWEKWLSGVGEPRLVDILKLIQLKGELVAFVSNIVNIKKVPSLCLHFEEDASLRELMATQPLVSIFICYLQLSSYREKETHQHGELAKQLKMSIKEEKEIFYLLESKNIIEWNGQKYCLLGAPSLNTGSRSSQEYLQALLIKKYWAQKGLEVIEGEIQSLERGEKSQGGRFGYEEVFASEESMCQIREEMAKCFYKIRKICEEDIGVKNQIKILNMQLLNLIEDNNLPTMSQTFNLDQFSSRATKKHLGL